MKKRKGMKRKGRKERYWEDGLTRGKSRKEKEEMRWKKKAALDPDTASPFFILSNDGKQVMCRNMKKNVSENLKRFTYHLIILGKQVTGESSSLLTEEQLQCSICLEVFTDPITTPCGHNFCKSCITQSWDTSPQCNCPYCKEKFTMRPELKINITLREVADHFKKKTVSEKPQVLCDICIGVKQKAVKSCLDCGVTFCTSHLEPHNYFPKNYKKHKLIKAVKNLEKYTCQKHERPLELFCRDDQMYLCQFCTEGQHKDHKVIPLEEESGQRKSQLGKTQSELQQMIQERLKKIQEINHSVELSKAELLKVIEEKQKAAEKQAEGLIKKLEQEIEELKKRDAELEQLSHTDDHLHLLQVYPSLRIAPHTKNWTEISINTELSVDTLRTALSQLQKTLNEKLSVTLNEKLRETVTGESSSLLTEEQLQCSICLEVFTDPVTTPCGHNFCKSCITQSWDTSPQCNCPYCKEKFTMRPELKINITLREVADHFKKKTVSEKPQKHKLIKAVKNLEKYTCQKHERPLELFCRDDQMYLCQFCTEGEHKDHKVIPLEEESGQRKSQLVETQSELQQMIQERLKKIQEINHSVELSKRNTEKEKSDSVKVFTSLIRSIESSQAELLKVMEEKQKAAEKQAEGLIKDLEQEIEELKKRDADLEQLSHTDDHLHLLQVYPSLRIAPHTKNWTEISVNTELSVDALRTALSQLQETLNEKLSVTLNEKLRETGSAHPYLSPLKPEVAQNTGNSSLSRSDLGRVVTEPPPLGTPPGVLCRGRPPGRGAGLVGWSRWKSSISEGSKMSEAGPHRPPTPQRENALA
ncbi:hypothetical protein QTP70_024791 [Hemibagrus guttatus]|uniref:Uncharacterized protein n=1 Tax=Hemibagrus guttatus TaxID=175788 RepID=A0AAE0V6D9_9TELE|nr:hypothetical protein QTP70_024791 [Hemibagrus guttatus]